MERRTAKSDMLADLFRRKFCHIDTPTGIRRKLADLFL
jgi:hypothetical protein